VGSRGAGFQPADGPLAAACTAAYHARNMTTCLVIRNPVSRRSLDERRLSAALDVAHQAGWDVTIATTLQERHATELARDAAARGVDVIVVNGGDGTINEAVNGIAGTAAALAVLRGGTANVWAGEIGMHRDPVKAMRQIVYGDRRRIDVGRADGRCFLLMAGIGFDAEIIPRVSGRLKRLIGPFAYIVAGVIQVFRATTWQARVRTDDVASDMALHWMLVSNTRSYGGITDIMFRAEADDGVFDVGVMHRGGPWHMVVDGIRVLLKRHERSPNVDYVKTRTLEIETPGLPVQLDGELWGATPMRFEVWPQSLTAIVPAGLKTPLFGRSR
jgi:diacylglycerol kinase (ATP)